ncbi:ComF family protein [Candidatus Margulisiibacteriota bacterium]
MLSQINLINLSKDILDLLLPNQCILCNGFTDHSVCQECLDKVQVSPKHISKSFLPKNVFSFFRYENEIKYLLGLLKFDKHRKIGELLSNKLVSILDLKLFQETDLWVPVPIHKKRYKKRGYNQVDVLFQKFISKVPGEYSKIIKRVKNTPPLFSKGLEDRQKILNTAFMIDPSMQLQLKDKKIVILDDILTSGSTVLEISALLTKYQVKEISIITFAYADIS